MYKKEAQDLKQASQFKRPTLDLAKTKPSED